METYKPKTCTEMRTELNKCLENSQVCTKLFMIYKNECLQRNAALKDSNNFVFGLERRHDGLPNTKVK